MILFGRARLIRTLDEQLDAARQGLSGVLVLKGPPGIGKTSLLAYAVERATDMRIARVGGKEAEQDLGLAGLHRLLLPFLHDLDRLPRRSGTR